MGISKSNRRLRGDYAAQEAFAHWRESHPGGTLDEFFNRKRGQRHARPHDLRRALRRLHDPDVPERLKDQLRQDVERLKSELQQRGVL